jgi:hypothetical protein
LDSSNNIFRFNYGKKSFAHLTGSLSQITVGEGDIDSCHPYEVWGINSNQNLFRYNYCTKQFDSISGLFTQISTSGGAVWGFSPPNPDVFAFNFSNQTFTDTGIGGFVVPVAASPEVWLLDSQGSVFFLFGFGASFGLGQIPGTLTQISAGGDGVWGINSNQNIFRFDPGSGNFVNVPGFLALIAAGSGAGVWGVSPNSGDVFTFVRP